MTEYERMRAGRIYDCMDAELGAAQRESHRLCEAYNALGADDGEKKQALLQELFPGQDFGLYRTLEAPVFLDNAREIRIGKNFYANVSCSFIAGGQVEIGDNVFVGPYCTLATGIHSLLPEERRIQVDADGSLHDYEYGRSIRIGSDVWIAANVTICGGVTIGDGSVIGAGSVVTKDIPANSIAVGNPCRVLRTLSETDSMKHHPERFGKEEFVFE